MVEWGNTYKKLLGGIDKEENLAALQKNIDAALAKDSAK